MRDLAIVEMKRRNPRFGCRRIAQQLAFVFGVEIDKNVVRRVLAKHYRPTHGSDGPSWLTFLGHAKDSLWSVDVLRGSAGLTRSQEWADYDALLDGKASKSDCGGQLGVRGKLPQIPHKHLSSQEIWLTVDG